MIETEGLSLRRAEGLSEGSTCGGRRGPVPVPPAAQDGEKEPLYLGEVLSGLHCYWHVLTSEIK